MKQELEKQISVTKEVLSAMALNNSKNIEKYKEELEKNLQFVQNILKQIIDLLRESNSQYEKLIENPQIKVLAKRKKELEQKLRFLNSYNSSFEKLQLDVILYDISKYYKGNLKEVNQDITYAIAKFQEVGIELSIKDFNYCHYVKEYMEEFFNRNADLETAFEKIYWRCPNIIPYIESNIRYLYFKNKKYFDRYVLNKQNDILKTQTQEDLIKEYYNTAKNYYGCIKKDTFLNFDKFRKKELKISDYEKDKIEKIYTQFTSEKNEMLYDDVFEKLYYNIEEYKNCLTYRFIYDDLKRVYSEKEQYKKATRNKMKEIKKAEKKLFYLNKKYSKEKNLDKKAKFDLEINNLMKNLNVLYQDFANASFYEMSFSLSDNSSIESLFYLAASYYPYLVGCIKKQFPDMEEDQVNQMISEFKAFLLNPNNTMINHLNITEEYDFPMIISDKYKLMNVEVPIESLAEANLETLLSQIKLILDYNIFCNLSISMNQIDLYCQTQELLKNVD